MPLPKITESIAESMYWTKIDISSQPEETHEQIETEDESMNEYSDDDSENLNDQQNDMMDESDDSQEEDDDGEESDNDSWDELFWQHQNHESGDESDTE